MEMLKGAALEDGQVFAQNVEGERVDPSLPGIAPRVGGTEIFLNFNSPLPFNGG